MTLVMRPGQTVATDRGRQEHEARVRAPVVSFNLDWRPHNRHTRNAHGAGRLERGYRLWRTTIPRKAKSKAKSVRKRCERPLF